MQLIEKLKSKKAVIGIVGMGYVGLPLFLRYAEVGYRVIGIDIDQDRVDCLNSGKSYIEHISSEKIIKAFAGDTCAVINFEEVGKVDALIICVPTPLNKYREPDLSFVTSTLDSVKGYLRKDQVLSLESTTYPGTTDELLLPVIESQGLTVGKDFYLVYSPEREDPGNASYSTQTIPKVCGGVTAACLEVGVALYQEIVEKVIAVSSTRTAEMTKLLENIHRAVNIGLVNEMKIVADSMQRRPNPLDLPRFIQGQD